MKYKILYCLILFGIIVLIYSCSSTKYIPEGEYWLENVSIKSDTKKISALDLEPYIQQKGNFKTFTLVRLPLFIYNLSGSDTTRWINRAIRSGGEPPVIYDSTKVQETVKDLEQVLSNMGYVHASVTPEIKKTERKVSVKYRIHSGNPYIISDYAIHVPDSLFTGNLNIRPSRRRTRVNDTINVNDILHRTSLVKDNSLFDLDMLDEERGRITSAFRRMGYYDFNKEYLGFVADTTAGKDKVDLELAVYPFMERLPDGKIIESQHKQYRIKEVNFYVDYNPLEDPDIKNYNATDTVYRMDGQYKIFYGKRGNYIQPHVILNNCYIIPGSLYDENTTASTYNAMSQLHILRNVNIRYEHLADQDSTELLCIITCVPDKKQGISTELEGTNSGGRFGIGAGIGYTHRNFFRGSELFNAKIKGAYEAITPSFSSFYKNYFEIGGEMSVTFPRFMFPFLDRDLRKRLNASTQLTTNYIYQRRPGYFTRTILSARIGYHWQNRRTSSQRHSLDLVNVSYIHIPELNSDFENKLTSAAKVYSFTDQFILSTGYTYTNTNFNVNNPRRRLQPIYSVRASVESAGNLLSLISLIANTEKGEDGKKIFGTRYSQYLSGNLDYSRTIPIDEKNSFAWRLGGGIVFPYGNNKIVPIQKRFFSGGANSVRGWGIRDLGPGAFYRAGSDFYDHSGDIRFDANIEFRSKVFWIIELAAFVDAGNIWTIKKYEGQEEGNFKWNSFLKEIAVAWGLGIRLDFDYFLIRLDCGWKAYDPANRPKYQKTPDGYDRISGFKSKWAIARPFDFKHNTAWHIAVGYPF